MNAETHDCKEIKSLMFRQKTLYCPGDNYFICFSLSLLYLCVINSKKTISTKDHSDMRSHFLLCDRQHFQPLPFGKSLR